MLPAWFRSVVHGNAEQSVIDRTHLSGITKCASERWLEKLRDFIRAGLRCLHFSLWDVTCFSLWDLFSFLLCFILRDIKESQQNKEISWCKNLVLHWDRRFLNTLVPISGTTLVPTQIITMWRSGSKSSRTGRTNFSYYGLNQLCLTDFIPCSTDFQYYFKMSYLDLFCCQPVWKTMATAQMSIFLW